MPHVINKTTAAEFSASHVIDLYKLYVEMADRISQRRQTANAFFLSINTALFSLAGYLAKAVRADPIWMSSLALIGIVVSVTWARSIRSYRDLNTGKFQVIHDLEDWLPLRLYSAEWIALGEGHKPKIYHPFTAVEAKIPWIFSALYFGLAAYAGIKGGWLYSLAEMLRGIYAASICQ